MMIEIQNNIYTDNLNENEYLNSSNIEKHSDNELLNYALHYAKIGYSVIPLHNVIINKEFKRCSCVNGKNCETAGKHPRTRFGHKEATTSESIIKKWWTSCPNANIGILTGIDTGIFVLDIDVRHGGEYSLENIKDYYRHQLNDNYDCENTITAYSGSGGRHLIYKHPIDFKIHSSGSKIDAGLDIKSEESYIVAPPSNHWSGRKYSWHGVNTAITDAPNWIIHEVLTSEKEPNTSNNMGLKLAFAEKVPNGERNIYLFKQASGLVNSFPEKTGLEILLKKNKEKLIEPLPEKEVERIAKNTWKVYGKLSGFDRGLRK
jgi:Bifunctional DNA primase/polymerase, N-terminal